MPWTDVLQLLVMLLIVCLFMHYLRAWWQDGDADAGWMLVLMLVASVLGVWARSLVPPASWLGLLVGHW
jgi:hypothetical protein